MNLQIDSERWGEFNKWDGISGVYVRAKTPEGSYESVDVCFLDDESLIVWLSKYDESEIRSMVKLLKNLGAL
jgi:hypothetical protein